MIWLSMSVRWGDGFSMQVMERSERAVWGKKSAGLKGQREGKKQRVRAAETQVRKGRKERRKTTLCHNLNEP